MNIALLPTPKLEPRHLRLQAIVYVRQSTQRQIVENQESTRRQYQLAERARQMGWPSPQVQVVDDDLGLSGASSHQRTSFQRLVAAIGLGEVGMVLVTEVSRLSRRNSDWHRVIELCAVFRTLIADRDAVYDRSYWCPHLLVFGAKSRWSTSPDFSRCRAAMVFSVSGNK